MMFVLLSSSVERLKPRKFEPFLASESFLPPIGRPKIAISLLSYMPKDAEFDELSEYAVVVAPKSCCINKKSLF